MTLHVNASVNRTTATIVRRLGGLELSMFCCSLASLLLTTTVISVDAIACPSLVCTCRWKGGKETAECAGKRLASLPAGLSRGTQVLDLSRNSFEELSKEMFFRASLTNLQKVYLAECKIRRIDDAAFSHLANLVELDLESNLLIAVPSETFVDCPGLRRLNLNRNHIRRVESNAFAKVPWLTSLELSNCFLEYVGPRAFVGLDHLQHLKLDGNQLAGLPPDVGFPLASLHSLDLFDNPWHCDCRLRVLRNWLLVDKLPVNAAPLCSEPLRLRDSPLVDVQPDDYACEPQTSSQASYSEAYTAGESVSTVLECHVQADPPPLIRWSRNDQIISNRTDVKQRYVVSELGTVQKTGFLAIRDVSIDDAGQYLCMAENVAGQIILNVTLDVVERQLELSTLSDGHVALISLGLVLVSLTTIVFLFIFLARMRHQQLDETLQCKHGALDKKQLVNHVKFSVHKERLEMTSTTTVESKPLCSSVINANNYNSNTPLQEKIRLEDNHQADQGGGRVCNRPDIVNIACNALSDTTEDSSALLRSSFLPSMPRPRSSSPSERNCDTRLEPSSPSVPPSVVRRSESREMLCGSGCAPSSPDRSVVDKKWRLRSNDSFVRSSAAGPASSNNDDDNDGDDEPDSVEASGAAAAGGFLSRRPMVNGRTLNVGNRLAADSVGLIPSNTSNPQRTQGALNKALAAAAGRRCAAGAASASASVSTLGNATGMLKHANLHGRNYVPVLPPLPAHHFAQARDSPDEGYEDEVEEELQQDT